MSEVSQRERSCSASGTRAAVAAGPRRSPGVVQEHQGQQPRGLGVTTGIVGHRRQLPGEPDRLGGQVDVAGVALVEDQVQHSQHGRQIARLGEPHVADRAFGPADPLRHRGLRDEVGLRDLPGGQAADGAQHQGHRGRRGQRRMGAEEEQLQRVVCGLGRSRRRLGLDPQLPIATRDLGATRVEELAPGHRDQPALRVGGALIRPGQRGLDQRLLHGVLGRREVDSATDEDTDHRGRQLPQQQFVHVIR